MHPAGTGEGTGSEDHRFPRAARIRRSQDIKTVFRRGKRVKTPALHVYVLPSSRPRMGCVVPKLGHGIVARNRLKRRLKEIGRRRVLVRLHEAKRNADILVRARRGAYGATYKQLEGELAGVVEAVCSGA